MKSLKNYTPVNLKTGRCRVKVTLNIPKSLQALINAELKRRGMSMGEFLHFLLSRYDKLLISQYYRAFLPSSMSIFIRYQKRGQNLEQESLKVAPEDWAKLGIMSIALGASRSLIFAHCVRLLVYGASDLLKTPQMRRAYWHALARKQRMVRLVASAHLDEEMMRLLRTHQWEFEKTPNLIVKI